MITIKRWEHAIRRRRPTPATLFRLTDPPSPDEDSGSHQWVLGENGALKAKLVHMSTYQPPSLKAVQRMAQAHLSSLDMTSMDKEDSSSDEEEQHDEERDETASATDLKEESKPLRDQCGLPDSSTESADLSYRQEDKDEAKEREEGKGE
ncbi:protein phosphatase 1 regulatory subunit 1B-like isoform X2 [Brachyistius frenatus]|uniref:protein phosphatase 1 regulatory subunit 1B-like isoform X2 n=1 Tax=Brachyistius frenatus TaxID=100188 RepID=UPI0037E949C0